MGTDAGVTVITLVDGEPVKSAKLAPGTAGDAVAAFELALAELREKGGGAGGPIPGARISLMLIF